MLLQCLPAPCFCLAAHADRVCTRRRACLQRGSARRCMGAAHVLALGSTDKEWVRPPAALAWLLLAWPCMPPGPALHAGLLGCDRQHAIATPALLSCTEGDSQSALPAYLCSCCLPACLPANLFSFCLPACLWRAAGRCLRMGTTVAGSGEAPAVLWVQGSTARSELSRLNSASPLPPSCCILVSCVLCHAVPRCACCARPLAASTTPTRASPATSAARRRWGSAPPARAASRAWCVRGTPGSREPGWQRWRAWQYAAWQVPGGTGSSCASRLCACRWLHLYTCSSEANYSRLFRIVAQGVLCGDCLFARYGEHVEEAAANKGARLAAAQGPHRLAVCLPVLQWGLPRLPALQDAGHVCPPLPRPSCPCCFRSVGVPLLPRPVQLLPPPQAAQVGSHGAAAPQRQVAG